MASVLALEQPMLASIFETLRQDPVFWFVVAIFVVNIFTQNFSGGRWTTLRTLDMSIHRVEKKLDVLLKQAELPPDVREYLREIDKWT
jgi:hypothetical protein